MNAAENLHTIALRWTDLQDALGGASAPVWPPAGRMADYLRAIEQLDAEEQEAERHRALALRTLERDPAQLGERPIPIRLRIHDTMRVVHASLVACADQVATAVQRDPIRPPAPRRAAVARTRAERIAWEDHARRVNLAQEDAADPRRWKWTGTRPTAPYAALWLYARVQGAPGPFRPLPDREQQLIASIARDACTRVETALDIAAQKAKIAHPCPDCGGQLDMHGGAGALPVAHCRECGRTWSSQAAAA
ncbi:hypothetical protein ACFWR9_42255 [Streptomyces sp. NPDC058534]|uniref:hypothetical protein n=1 Tax=Streptomyces sp. NPDC058534 TaxID=3346541 RepID=UPI003660FFF3